MDSRKLNGLHSDILNETFFDWIGVIVQVTGDVGAVTDGVGGRKAVVICAYIYGFLAQA